MKSKNELGCSGQQQEEQFSFLGTIRLKGRPIALELGGQVDGSFFGSQESCRWPLFTSILLWIIVETNAGQLAFLHACLIS
jgi:hypothetical protein